MAPLTSARFFLNGGQRLLANEKKDKDKQKEIDREGRHLKCRYNFRSPDLKYQR
jgi:hypothetical protein